jgi:hypothetical protein
MAEVLHRLGVEKLVLLHVSVAEEVEDRPPVLGAELAQFEPFVLSAEQTGKPVLVSTTLSVRQVLALERS